ncbi:MAG: hypothetical protein WDZ52_03540 [Pseudohongiellaceae bacterium]
MNFFNKTTRLIVDALMHYVCLRLRFRSHVLNDKPYQDELALCTEDCCPAKG